MLLIQNKTITGLGAEVIDRVEDILRVHAVDRFLRVHNLHGAKSFPGPFPDMEIAGEQGKYIIPALRTVVKTLEIKGKYC